jgi:Holliday junction resolvase
MPSMLKELAERQLHLMILGDWKGVDPELLEYLEGELGAEPERDPIGVAFCLLKIGVSPERATSLLSWKDFENFCMRGLQIHGMEAIRGLRFKNDRRYEIDVLGIGEKLILLIDCKMWSMRGRSGRIESIARDHLRKAKAFDEAMRSESINDLIKESGKSQIIPVIVSWLDTGVVRSKEGVAIVSLRNFPSFLNSIDELEDFLKIDVDYRIKIRRETHSRNLSVLRF